MICDACEGWGNPQKKREWTFNQEEACVSCGGTGQVPSIDDQTFIVGQRKNDLVQVFAVQGNYRKDLLGEVKTRDKQLYFDLIEKIKKEPNVRGDQARAELNRVFQVMIHA